MFWHVLLSTSHVILLCLIGFLSSNTLYCVGKNNWAIFSTTKDNFREEKSFFITHRNFIISRASFFVLLWKTDLLVLNVVSVNLKILFRLQNAWIWGPFYRFLRDHLSKCKYQKINCKTTPMSSSKTQRKTNC